MPIEMQLGAREEDNSRQVLRLRSSRYQVNPWQGCLNPAGKLPVGSPKLTPQRLGPLGERAC
jgi:hypothetical protein